MIVLGTVLSYDYLERLVLLSAIFNSSDTHLDGIIPLDLTRGEKDSNSAKSQESEMYAINVQESAESVLLGAV